MSGKEKTMEEIAAYPIFNGQRVKFPQKIEGEHTLTVAMNPQKYDYLHFDETGLHSKVIIRPIEGDKQHKIFIPTEKEVFPQREIKHDSREQFWTVKPQSEAMTFNLGYGNKSVPLTLPQVFFEGNESMNIISSHWKIDQGGGSPDQVKSFVMPAISTAGFEQDDTYVMAQISGEIVAKEHLKEGENDFDSKSNEFYGQLVKSLLTNTGGAIGQTVDNFSLLKEFFPGGKFHIKEIKGVYYIIFMGNAKKRKFIDGTKYGLNNPKVISLSIAKNGAGIKGAAKATMAPFKEVVESGEFSALKGTLVGLVLIGAVDYIYWYKEGILSENGRYLTDLLIDIGSDFVKGLIGSVIAGFIVGAAIVALGVSAATLPVVLVIGATIFIGVGVGMGLDILDNQIGATETIKRAGRTLSDRLSEGYFDFEDHIKALYFNTARMTGYF
jgi:hypothetical protein